MSLVDIVARLTPKLFPCFRCEEPRKVHHPLTRCAPCEKEVTAIILGAAMRGHRVADPLIKLHNPMG
ncbi:hypothetical protein ACFQ8W_00180 [Streptomyces sp. NPDC056508]|uniref:hypothetical protein n=1 Tax=Streptomyces sp. NPDC056508 TaxID=3345845 RepID=UPI003682B768